MSDQSYEGAIKVQRLQAVGMITLRADLSSNAVAGALKAVLGLSVPQMREIVSANDIKCAWMSPDEVLLITPFDQLGTVLSSLEDALRSEHHLIVNVSDARAVFRLSGKGAREVIAKGAPVDLSIEGFGEGSIRRTRLGQLAVAFWMNREDEIDLVCFRSVGDFVFDWLSMASREGSLPEYL